MAHPIRNETINVWCAPEGQDTPRWIAKFGLGRAFPIFFEGETEAAVRNTAEAFREDVCARHEATYEARVSAMEKARAARKAKAAAS
jgi:hypothetical protein